eukprot:gnl/TRDRNA2_/TRDRNA2_188503_c0_seq1.p1 gnl/TRDRNA2_/TRDRNA2_188503_c0~~gnl/TRDRNA2_/TRDRNA2_188503_c0_seq1.p1  ORF type:complete len:705 (+),score=75.14 gnl/TRDRNA2_/TRDRNA2_188503_c0_seq1:61-2175(+)
MTAPNVCQTLLAVWLLLVTPCGAIRIPPSGGIGELPDASLAAATQLLNAHKSVNPKTRTHNYVAKGEKGEPPDTLAAATKWLNERKSVYEKASFSFAARGAGYLHEKLGLILTLRWREPYIWIEDLAGRSCDPNRISIWVRVAGPQLHAGLATPSTSNKTCRWHFDLHNIQETGNYTVEAKLLNLDGGLDTNYSMCNIQRNVAFKGEVLQHLKGSKLYNRMDGCCEACTRDERCTHWTTPAIGGERDAHCTLFSKVTAKNKTGPELPAQSMWDAPPRGMFISGTKRNERTSRFLGCGWSCLLSHAHPCLHPNDDRIMNFGMKLFVHRKDPAFMSSTSSRTCRTPSEVNSPGHWQELSAAELAKCSKDASGKSPDVVRAKLFPVLKYDEGDGYCWYKEVLHDLGSRCAEADCPEFQSRLVPVSNLSTAERTTAFKWVPNHCQLPMMEPSQIQECVTRKKIASFRVVGDSVMDFFSAYVGMRLEHIQFWKGQNSTHVIVDDFSMPHEIWGYNRSHWESKIKTRNERRTNIIKEWGDFKLAAGFFDKESQSKDTSMYFKDATYSVWGSDDDLSKLDHGPIMVLWTNNQLISSEREEKVSLERSSQFIKLVRQNWGKRADAYELNYYGPSAAFTYESSTQEDGLHIVGPPMKALFNMAMHTMCTAPTAGEKKPAGQTRSAGVTVLQAANRAHSAALTVSPRSTGTKSS